MVGNEDLIEEMLLNTADRDIIAYGMRRRYLLQPATRYDWRDPRDADGVPILARNALGAATINQRIHQPFDRVIVNNKLGYAFSDILTTLDDGLPDKVKDFYKELDQKASFTAFQLAMGKRCIDEGAVYMLAYLDTAGDMKFRLVPADTATVIHDPETGLPVYGFRYDAENCYAYDSTEVTYWKKENGHWYAESTKPHGLGTVDRPMVPVIEFRNNPEKMGNPEMSISTADAFDTAMSDLSSEIAQTRLAYLLVKGLGGDVATIKEQLTQAGVIVVDSDTGDAKFITKSLDSASVKLLQDELRRLVFEGASSFDPSSLADGGTPPTAFEISQRLHALEMDVLVTIGEWLLAFRQFDYLIQTYLMTFRGVSDYSLTDIDRIFRRVAPRNTMQSLVDAKNAGITISNETLLEISGLQLDPITERKRLVEQLEADNPVEDTTDEAGTEIPESGQIDAEPQVSVDAGAVGESNNVVSLNGAQVTSATEIVKAIGTGELTEEAALNMLEVLFNLKPEQARKMVAGMTTIKDENDSASSTVVNNNSGSTVEAGDNEE